jgi:hypothetical protein
MGLLLGIVIVAAFVFGCCAIPGFGRRLFKLVAAIALFFVLALSALWIAQIWDTMKHPLGSDEGHPIHLIKKDLANPPEGKFWEYQDEKGWRWTQKNQLWMVWQGSWIKYQKRASLEPESEPDFDAASEFAKWYFPLHPGEKLLTTDDGMPRLIGYVWQKLADGPESDLEVCAVITALHPGTVCAIEPETTQP